MKINRRNFLLNTALTAGSISAGCSQSPKNKPLLKAVTYLRTQQSWDGGFHSTTYGLLRSGQSLTPFVLYALLNIPDGEYLTPPGIIKKALKFIESNTNSDGLLGLADNSAPDYPNYATSLAICSIIRSRRSGYEQLQERMKNQLIKQQFNESNGWSPDSLPYGGWGMGGEIRRPPEAGHIDLSMTRHVLEALRMSGMNASNPTIIRALTFLEKSQNADGGFYFSPVNPEINKAGKDSDGSFLSYGTTTADGVLALRAAGIPDSDPRIANALKWLKEHHLSNRVPGFINEQDKIWGLGLRFYYAHVISRVLPELPISLPAQANDGSFKNDVNLVKEDDPLIATPFALYALARKNS